MTQDEAKMRLAARKKLAKAVRYGKIERPDTCSECGGDGDIQGHHADYTKPLDVEWLCRTCHGIRHRGDENKRGTGQRKWGRQLTPEDEPMMERLRDIGTAYLDATVELEVVREARNEAVRQALAEGMTHAEIAEVLGVTRGRINQLRG